MINWLKNLWSKIKEFTAKTKKSLGDWWYKHRRKIGAIIGVLLYTLCVFFLGYCSSKDDNSTAQASGIDIPVPSDNLSIVYSDISTPVFWGKMPLGSNGFVNMTFYGSYSLLFSIDKDSDIIKDIYLDGSLIYNDTHVYTTYLSMIYWNSFDKTEDLYGFTVELVDYNFPSSTTLETGALDMLRNSSFEMTYVVNNGLSTVITYEWVYSGDLYYIDLLFTYDYAYEFVDIYTQKFDYYVFDYSTIYASAFDTGFSMGYAEGANVGYQDGYFEGANVGYQNAINDGQSAGFFGSIAKMVNDLVSIELFPGVPLSYVILIAFGFVALRIILNLFAS